MPLCAVDASPEIRNALFDLGRRWAVDPTQPSIKEATLRKWDELLEVWISSRELPLLVRKARQNRGTAIRTASGRIVIPTDNSPAQWAFAVAYDGICPRISEVLDLLGSGGIPIAMALSAGAERDGATYRGLRGRCPGTAEGGWKLAHIEPVALGGRGPLSEYDRPILERHFRLLMSPRNMLVVPAAWSGLAEVDDFLEGFRSVTPAVPERRGRSSPAVG